MDGWTKEEEELIHGMAKRIDRLGATLMERKARLREALADVKKSIIACSDELKAQAETDGNPANAV